MITINFKLENIDEIIPLGQAPNQYLNWFCLTSGELSLSVYGQTIYDYSKDNAYYIAQLIEGLTSVAEKAGETMPDKLYRATDSIQRFKQRTKKWLDMLEYTFEKENNDFYDLYADLTSWVVDRTFDSGHLVDGIQLSFFRKDKQIRMIWEKDEIIEKGNNWLTAPRGSFDGRLYDFVWGTMRDFKQAFFEAMDKQIEAVLAKDWGEIKIDKERLLSEQQEQKQALFLGIYYLEYPRGEKTDWTKIEQLYDQMLGDVLPPKSTEYRYILVGNIIDKHYYGQEKEIRSGSKHFRAGAKVYLFPTYAGEGYTRITVYGLPRKSGRHIEVVMNTELLKNVRVQKTFDPKMMEKIDATSFYEWHENDTESLTRFATHINKNNIELPNE